MGAVIRLHDYLAPLTHSGIAHRRENGIEYRRRLIQAARQECYRKIGAANAEVRSQNWTLEQLAIEEQLLEMGR